MIVKDINQLKEKCLPTSALSYGEGEDIAKRLLEELSNSKNGIGLAANQIGINKRVCVINVKEEPLILINPEIIERSKETFVFPEGCLSFPNKHVRTIRNTSIKVKADNHNEELTFSADSKDYKDAFECACVQHEIDHLDGITMFDREFKQEPIKVNKIGRNEKVTLTKGSESKIIKFKKAQPLLEAGWILQS
jgi:peptide deformylase|tara:strand:- start:178 stop:756 length:579 start_codon:yes stop_codon:yes gene_type:complete